MVLGSCGLASVRTVVAGSARCRALGAGAVRQQTQGQFSVVCVSFSLGFLESSWWAPGDIIFVANHTFLTSQQLRLHLVWLRFGVILRFVTKREKTWQLLVLLSTSLDFMEMLEFQNTVLVSVLSVEQSSLRSVLALRCFFCYSVFILLPSNYQW